MKKAAKKAKGLSTKVKNEKSTKNGKNNRKCQELSDHY